MTALPTAKQLQDAVQEEGACRDLLLQAFSYGTDYDSFQNRDNDEASLSKRTKEASKVLVAAFEAEPSLQPLLQDTLWLVGSLVSSNESANEALAQILNALVKQVPDRGQFWVALQSSLDPSLLEAVGLLPQGGKESLLKKVRKINTETHYRQQKFNLLHEQSEGYAKLVTLLARESWTSSETLKSLLRHHIGTFALDPNRVLDLLVDALESHLKLTGFDGKSSTADDTTVTLLEVIRSFSLDKLPHLIGFKIRSNASRPIPRSLCLCIVLLTKEGLVELSNLRPHLPPSLEIEKANSAYVHYETLQIKAMGRIRLTDSSGGGPKEDPKLVESRKQVQKEKSDLGANALVSILMVLLECKEVELARLLLPSPSMWSTVCTLLPETVGNALCRLMCEQVQLIYAAIVPTPALSAKDGTDEAGQVASAAAIPVNASLDQVLQTISGSLKAVVESACIASHPTLYCELCRLLRVLVQNEQCADSVDESTYSVLQALVASLSLFTPNPAVAGDLWSLISILPYPTRYRLYQSWRGAGLEKAGLSSKPLVQVKSEMEAGRAARYALKRLSKENVRDMGRQMSKVTHSNPLVVFTTILNQIESYDNLIEMMIESVRSVTPLGLDVLGFCILTRLMGSSDAESGRSRVKDDGVHASQWLSSLESFTGAFYRRCPGVECRGIVQFIVRRLTEGHVQELGVLRTLLKTAGGYGFADYGPVASLATGQLEGRTGSQLLKRETFAFGVVERFNHIAARRLRSVLQSDNMGVTVLILLAQIRGTLVFGNSGQRAKPVKLIGNLFDTCQVVMEMLLEFLTDTTEGAEGDGPSPVQSYASDLPPLDDLLTTFGLNAESAWILCRPVCRAALAEESDATKNKNGSEKAVMAYLPSSTGMRAVYPSMLPEAAWSNLSTELFELFYSLSLYDIGNPKDTYEAEVARLQKDVERLVQLQKGTPGSLQMGQRFGKAEEAQLERLRRHVKVLSSDMSKQSIHFSATHERAESIKDKLFKTRTASIPSVHGFLTHCIYPRCLVSPDDALYCTRFVELLHSLGTPGFSTMNYFDNLVGVLAGALYCVTETEAAAMGIVLLETWRLLSRWRYDEEAFEDEVAGKPGSTMELQDSEDAVKVSREDYVTLYNKWHATLGAAALGCLKSTEYMYTRAGLVVLTRIVDVFPTRPGLGQKLIDELAPIQQDDYPLPDIRTTAQAYAMLIERARMDGVWKEEDVAVAKARADKEKAAIAERKKKAEQQFAEMKRESERITEELGESETRGREDRRRGTKRGQVPQMETRRSAPPTFEPAGRGSAEKSNGHDGLHRTRGRDEEGARARDGPGSGRDQHSSLGGRWERGTTQAVGRGPPALGKRPRSPERDEQGPTRQRGRNGDDHRGPPPTGQHADRTTRRSDRRGGQQRR